MSYLEGRSTTDDESDTTSSTSSELGGRKSRKAALRLIKNEIHDEPKASDKKERPKLILLGTAEKLKEDAPVPAEHAPDNDISKEETSVLTSVLREEAKRKREIDPLTTEIDVAVTDAINDYDEKLKIMAPEQAANEVLSERGIDASELQLDLEDYEDELELKQSDEPIDIDGEGEVNLADFGSETDDEYDLTTTLAPISSFSSPASSTSSTTTTGTPPPPPPPVTPPPSGPTPPFGGGPPTPPVGPGGPPSPALGHNRLNNTVTMTTAEYVYQRRRDLMDGALMGGIVGYLVGRRRGRIKTEKKLMPIQKKLEKKVVKLESRLTANEYRIKKLVSDKYNQEAKINSQDKQLRSANFESRQVAARALNEAVMNKRQKAPEAKILHVDQPVPERIGQLIILGEAAKVSTRNENAQAVNYNKAEYNTDQTIQLETAKAEALKAESGIDLKQIDVRKVETMNREELLKISQKISVEGSTLRQIYETHLVGEQGLRRLVSEYLQGHDLNKALRKEIVEREIDFERDPVMRDMSSGNNGGGGSNRVLDSLVAKAAETIAPNTEETAFYKAKADYENKQFKKAKQRKKTTDAAIGATVAVLLAVIVVLFLTH